MENQSKEIPAYDKRNYEKFLMWLMTEINPLVSKIQGDVQHSLQEKLFDAWDAGVSVKEVADILIYEHRAFERGATGALSHRVERAKLGKLAGRSDEESE